MRISIYKTLGSFNWANPSAKQWQLIMRVDEVSVSALFQIDEEPEIDGEIPSVVLDILEKRIKQSFGSSRTKGIEVIAKLRENIKLIDLNWHLQEIERISKQIQRLSETIRGHQLCADDMAEEIKAEAA